MPIRPGPAQPAPSGSRLEAYEGVSWRMRGALLIAGLLHAGFLLLAYLRPLPPPPNKARPIFMEVVVRPPTPVSTTPPPVPTTPTPTPPPPTVVPPKTPPASSRPLPKELQPVKSNKPSDATGPAIVVPVQPPPPPGAPEPTGEMPKGPINLFPKSLATVMGAPGATGPVPKGPDRLLKDERLEEKKGPEFELVPEKGGGFKFEGKNFIAHIKPDGGLAFDNRFPIGFNKGGTFSFDITDLAMRGKKMDPYQAEKRRFGEFSEKIRVDLRNKFLKEQREHALETLGQQLHDLWASGRTVAARRRDIYEMWEDCSDDKNETLGRKGRQIIIDFIRTSLPAGSADAYTEEELERINKTREGLPPFKPYS